MAGRWVWACLALARGLPLLKITVENTCYPSSLAGPRPIPLLRITTHCCSLQARKLWKEPLLLFNCDHTPQTPQTPLFRCFFFRYQTFSVFLLHSYLKHQRPGRRPHWVRTEEEAHLECAGSLHGKGVVKGWVHTHILASSLTRNHTHVHTRSNQGAALTHPRKYFSSTSKSSKFLHMCVFFIPKLRDSSCVSTTWPFKSFNEQLLGGKK